MRKPVAAPEPEPVAPVSVYVSNPNVHEQTVTRVTHHTDSLFSFRITRPQSFRFRSGEFAMIGLPNAERPVFRAYSVASPAWDDELEFYSIKVPDGPLTEHLQKIAEGDTVLLRPKATGTLTLDSLLPGKRLFLFSTGTGFAPFASIIRDPETYEKFEQVIVTHTCRTAAELAYGHEVVAGTREDPIVGELADESRLVHFTSLTREPHAVTGRITDLMEAGTFPKAVGVEAIDPEHDRAMICGSSRMLADTKDLCIRFGLEEGSNARPNTFVVERAFVDAK
ncbi:ferredoxin--NADP reductase [Tepidamorphus sp. 3E244]|uniref:ferredoxin--NADP reductase n=1 Tax=Tepidamorphus sp. 3E244 TaxID=3385498 RepID=UPI0038FC0CC1